MMEDGSGKIPHVEMVAVLAADIIGIPPCMSGLLRMRGLFLRGWEAALLILLVSHVSFHNFSKSEVWNYLVWFFE